MKKLIEQLNAIARKHNNAASAVCNYTLAYLKSQYGVDVSAPAVNAPADDDNRREQLQAVVNCCAAIRGKIATAPLPVQVFGKPVTPPATDAIIKFEVGKIYAERRRKYVDSDTEYYFIKPIKIVKRTSQFIECVPVNPRTLEAYGSGEHRAQIHVYKEFYGCLPEESIRLDKLVGTRYYYASNVITSPDELTQRPY